MANATLHNIPTMNPGQVIEQLSSCYSAVIQAGGRVKDLPAAMLWGPPGVGKSQAVQQIAGQIGRRTGKKVRVTDVRLLLFNPIDLRGIPTANADKTLAVWLKPKIFQMDESEDVINLLFLDELTAAPQAVQAAAYQITLDRVVGEHRLPDNCIVIAAGNRTTDRSVAFKMPKALANRLLHLQVEGDFASWKQWAVGAGIHPTVLGFLSFRSNYLMQFDAANDDLAFPTPRSWEMVSNLLNQVSGDVEAMYPLICGLVGTGAAVELRTWAKVCATLPKIEDIFAGKAPVPPKGTDALYALCSAMVAYARAHREDLQAVARSVTYAQQLPPDFSAMLLKDYMYIAPDYRATLLTMPEFVRWLRAGGRLLNGSF